MTLYRELFDERRRAEVGGLDRTMVIGPDQSPTTYREFDRAARQMTAALAEMELRPGDRIVAQLPKSFDALRLYFACLAGGFVYVPLNPAYTPTEVDYFITDAAADLLVIADDSSIRDTLSTPHVKVVSLDVLAKTADEKRPAAVVTRVDNDLATMIYTSGTTGRSKGAMVTHANLLANAVGLRDVWQIETNDVLVHTLPIFHVHGLFVAIHPLMLERATILLRLAFSVDDVLEQLPHATLMMGVPTHYTRLLNDDRFDQSVATGMRLFTSGSAPMTVAVHDHFAQRSGHRIVERYGMSECGILTSNPIDGERIPGTVGYPLPGVELRVCDETGAPVGADITGQVEVRGPGLFAGYWNQPDKTAAEMRPDGFFRTGDVGSLSGDGRLTLEGRSSDMIISGGLNVYPKEIELVLDAVDGVVESSVIGLPHADFGEAVLAIVVVEEGVSPPSAAIAQSLGERLARFKHPKRIVYVDALPRNAMGKIQKAELRNRWAGTFVDDAASQSDHTVS